ncbi:MAG: HlyD family efflux transporter periplasmic adaptor subunit [Opitutaceae bacterium]|nr:HlyD family efflux transporter periplasmic adaptor subunit [Opitutaceae bacterium]
METESSVLPQNPPSWILRLIAWLLCMIAAVAALAAVLVKLPETVRCPFVLVSATGAETLLAPIQGVLTAVKAEEGAEVAAGTTLFVLRSDEIRNWQTQQRTGREDLRALQERAVKLDEIQAAQVAIKGAQIVQTQREVAFREKHLATNQDFLASMEKLDAEGGLAKIEMMSHRLNLASSEKDLLVAQKGLQQVALELEQLKIERVRQRIDEQAESEKLRIRNAALEQQLENCEGDLMFIRAPYAATVVALDRRSGGNLVRAGESLGQLARRDEKPHARLRLDESALARLQAHQSVRFFFEAFPYQRYGSVTGRLDWITPAAVSARDTAQFMAVASLDQTTLRGGGEALPLRVGMKGEARILVGSRTLVEHIFEPIRQLRENMR